MIDVASHFVDRPLPSYNVVLLIAAWTILRAVIYLIDFGDPRLATAHPMQVVVGFRNLSHCRKVMRASLVPQRTQPMLLRFFRSEPAAAIILLVMAAFALIVANSSWQENYYHLLESNVAGLSVHHWINDALMAVFFLMVGLEIKREMVDGALSSWADRMLPGVAALGGMAVPALIFVGINWGQSDLQTGWAIPTATDIAFAIGVITILGRRVPAAARILLVGVAIIDDLLAILVIALFYSDGIAIGWLALAGVIAAALFMLNKTAVMSIPPYLVLGVFMWVAVYNSGLHATLAGVIVALAIPSRHTKESSPAPLNVLEYRIAHLVNFGILPLFGFANAGVSFGGLGLDSFVGTLPLGIMLGLFVGKQVGIFGAIWLSVRLGVARMPNRVTWTQLHAMAIICGIGFTMSIFIGTLAFEISPEHLDSTKIGVIIGSVISAIVGSLLMLRSTDKPQEEHPSKSETVYG